jgi:hypothetical protein
MIEPYTSGSIGAVKNDNSGLAGLEINLGASKGRRSRHHTLYPLKKITLALVVVVVLVTASTSFRFC